MTTVVLWSLAVIGGMTVVVVSAVLLTFAAGWFADRSMEYEREQQLAAKGRRVRDLYWLTEWPILADVAAWTNDGSGIGIGDFREQLREKYPQTAAGVTVKEVGRE